MQELTHNQRAYQRYRAKHPIGAVVWEGDSLIDGAPLVVIATGLDKNTRAPQRKIGDMLQLWILRSDMNPYDALKSGSDVSICGDCKFRPTSRGSTTGRACYVQVWPYVSTIWETFMRDRYKPIYDFEGDPFAGKHLRLGAYGDPAAVPTMVWDMILRNAAGWTAYTHAWRTCDPALRSIAMASVDGVDEMAKATAMGWRCFRTRFKTEDVLENEIVCPASEEGGHRLQCATCGLCKGTSLGGKHIAIINHGPGGKNYAAARERSPRLRVVA